MKQYCEAFFLGCTIKLVRPGDTIEEKTKMGQTKKKQVPSNFVEHHKIAMRDNDFGPQLNAANINKALQEYKNSSTYCVLAATNTDLYPRPDWNFVFGMANLTTKCGVFSFCRQMIGLDSSMSEDEMRKMYIKLSVGTMVHEITHMFGVHHCIYYECTMGGSMGSEEQLRRPARGMCPVCIYKLKVNINFDTGKRY